MGILVGMGAQCMCTMGLTPAPLMILPQKKAFGENKPIGNPGVKPPFVPMAPCVPNTAAPWMPGSPTVLVGNVPALNNSCKLICNYGGVISIMNPGMTKVMVK